MFQAHRAHHQERQIVSIQPLVTVILCWWPRCEQVRRSFFQPAHIVPAAEAAKPLIYNIHVYKIAIDTNFTYPEFDLKTIWFG
jgi:hypothetical protein